MGGSPFDKDGLDTYQLTGWGENVKLTQLNFVIDEGDAKHVKLEVYDRPFSTDAKLLHTEVLDTRSWRTYDPPIELRGSLLGRMYLRLIATDGVKQNHCKCVFLGAPL